MQINVISFKYTFFSRTYVPLVISKNSNNFSLASTCIFSNITLLFEFPIINSTMAKYLYLVNVFPISLIFIEAKN